MGVKSSKTEAAFKALAALSQQVSQLQREQQEDRRRLASAIEIIQQANNMQGDAWQGDDARDDAWQGDDAWPSNDNESIFS